MVSTYYGNATIQSTLTTSTLTFIPGLLVLSPGDSGNVTASINPPLSKDITIVLRNSNPLAVSVPQSVLIPSSGMATFPVDSSTEGVSTIDSGDSKTVVYVTEPFTPAPGEKITSMAKVSVYIEAPDGGTTVSSLPVSVYRDTPAGDATAQAVPVSLYVNNPQGDATDVALPISVKIATDTITDAAIASHPLSILVESSSSVSTTSTASLVSVSLDVASAVNASESAHTVSVYVEPVPGSQAVSSSPVSVYVNIPAGGNTVISPPVSVKISPQ
ncbi:hypothetical protein BMS3Abin07_01396 [bacterium BMS3Abin07]|nr:hypothetical protein BMS3Abin07_01396 [bacterium BMS3Abin07]GBE32677.1 hypothetical protein BMS3Bbin05_01594 [bacterium BMS3Bbin05]